MRYASVCDGIGAAHVAWQPLGWDCRWTAEIDPFPSAVVGQRWGFENRGDMTKFKEWNDGTSIDLLVGGTPCQSFSVAGLRQGLHDPRGGLMLTFLEIAQRYRTRWIVWENVPGVLSSNGGRDFGSFLGALGDLGYGWAYRVLDAQWFGVAQRRRRVFVVGCLGDERRAGQILFERESVCRDHPPRRTPGEKTSGPIAGCSNGGGANGPGRTADDADSLVVSAVCSKWSKGTGGPAGDECQNLVAAHAIPFDTTQICSYKNYSNPRAGDPCHPLAASAHVPAVAFTQNSRDEVRQIAGDGTIAGALSAESGTHQTNYIAFANRTRDGVKVPEVMKGGLTPALTNPGHGGRSDAVNVAVGMGVRRLTPRECERLQGFPDDYTLIEWRNKAAADGPRYKALGNSMAVPVMRWIGERIALADSMERQRQ